MKQVEGAFLWARGFSGDPASTDAAREGASGGRGVRLAVPWDSSTAPAPLAPPDIPPLRQEANGSWPQGNDKVR